MLGHSSTVQIPKLGSRSKTCVQIQCHSATSLHLFPGTASRALVDVEESIRSWSLSIFEPIAWFMQFVSRYIWHISNIVCGEGVSGCCGNRAVTNRLSIPSWKYFILKSWLSSPQIVVYLTSKIFSNYDLINF